MLKAEKLFSEHAIKIFFVKSIRIISMQNYFQKINCKTTEFESHKYNIIKLIVEHYSKIRIFHELKKKTMENKKTFVRSKHTKLVIFSNQ